MCVCVCVCVCVLIGWLVHGLRLPVVVHVMVVAFFGGCLDWLVGWLVGWRIVLPACKWCFVFFLYCGCGGWLIGWSAVLPFSL